MENIYDNYNKIFFSGVLGVSMSALCKHSLALGKSVGGSDVNVGKCDSDLVRLPVSLYKDNLRENVESFNPDALVYTSAISPFHQEITYAKTRGIPLVKRSVFLNECIKGFRKRIGVCGSHGKTTTTSMLAHCLIADNLNPTVFLGGEDLEFGNYRYGDGEFALVEACEYKKNFLDLKVNYSIVLNIDNDHLESYNDMQDMIGAYNEFSSNGVAIINADDHNCHKLTNSNSVTFGIDNSATYMAKKITFNGKGYSFTLFRNGVAKTKIDLVVEGKHNVYNALAVCTLADLLGVSLTTVKDCLSTFVGVKRRMEGIGFYEGLECITDYAHHPKEIKATLKAIEERGKEYLVVFQPHTFSRTKMLLGEFVKELLAVNRLIIYQTYPARENYDKDGSSKRLYEEIKKSTKTDVYHACDENTLKMLINGNKEQVEGIIFLGAGDIYNVAKNLVEKKQ